MSTRDSDIATAPGAEPKPSRLPWWLRAIVHVVGDVFAHIF